jgi:RNA-directed DNA polymerase
MMHGHEKSDPAIVAVKPANKAEQLAAEQTAAELTAAEPVEPRAGTKGNAGQQSTCRAQSRISVSQALERIRKVARERKKEKFISLFHHISVELLEEAFYELKADAAPGVDRLTWKDYEANLERNLQDLARLGPSGSVSGRADGSTYPSRTVDSVRSRSLPWRTRSSSGQWSRC